MKKVIIIGGGMAGLSVGCYLQMNGYETEIFEMHRAGGLCTAWKRGDYLIDGCIHWFVGRNPKSGMYKIWDELIDMKSMKIAPYGEFSSLEKDGKVLRLYADLDKLQKELEEISPEDAGVIREMITAAKEFSVLDFENFDSLSGATKVILAMLPILVHYKKWITPVDEYAKKFKNPLIRELLVTAFSDLPMAIFLVNAATFHNQNAGYPVGGAEEVVRRLVNRYESLGGKLYSFSKIEKVLVKNNTAVGIELANKKTYGADIVISAADGYDTIMRMLGQKYVDKKIKELYYDKKYEPKTSVIYVALGVKRTFDDSFKPYVFFPVKKPLVVDKKKLEHLGVTIHNFDPKAAPAGKTVLTLMIQSSDPKYWINLRKENINEYEKQKRLIADRVIEEVDGHFGHIKDTLEVVDVATPATYVEYTNNWNGAPMGWQDPKLFLFQPKKYIDGLGNFYMCGQWAGGVGLPGAAQTGKYVAKLICKNDHKKFQTKSFKKEPLRQFMSSHSISMH